MNYVSSNALNTRIVPLTRQSIRTILNKHLEHAVSDLSDFVMCNYQQSMIHSSYVVESPQLRDILNRSCTPNMLPLQAASYDRLEYLGDAILGSITAAYLVQRYPFENEGFLTRMRTHIVNGRMLANLCLLHTDLPQHIAISATLENNSEMMQSNDDAVACTVMRHEMSHRKLPRGVLEDVLEAFIGALFLHMGYDSTAKWVIRFLESHVDFAGLALRQDTPRALLNRYCQSHLGYLPTVEVTDNNMVRLLTPSGAIISSSSGSDRRDAEDKAVMNAIIYYGLRM